MLKTVRPQPEQSLCQSWVPSNAALWHYPKNDCHKQMEEGREDAAIKLVPDEVHFQRTRSPSSAALHEDFYKTKR